MVYSLGAQDRQVRHYKIAFFLGIKQRFSMYYRNNTGGWNKDHEQVEKTPRIDSFEVPSLHGTGCLWCGNGLIQAHKVDERSVLLHLKGGDQRVFLSYSPNGFGGQQTFFLCPECGGRVRFLYLTRQRFLCRRCARLNYRCQQRTKGSTAAFDVGLEYARKALSPPSTPLSAMDFCNWTPLRPRYMHRTTYQKRLKRFLRYRQHHEARTLADLLRIIGPKGRAEIAELMRE